MQPERSFFHSRWICSKQKWLHPAKIFSSMRTFFLMPLFFLIATPFAQTQKSNTPQSPVDTLKGNTKTASSFIRLKPEQIHDIYIRFKDTIADSEESIISITQDTVAQVYKVFLLNSDNTSRTVAIRYKDLDKASNITIQSNDTARKNTDSLHKKESIIGSQDGRVYFMAQTTAKAAITYAVGLSELFPRDTKVITGVSLLTLGGALYGSYLFTENRELGYGRVAMMNFGGELGCFHYPFLVKLFMESLINNSKVSVDRTHALLSMIGLPLGIYAGSSVNFFGNREYGDAAIACYMSRWSWLYGFLLPNYLDFSSNNYVLVASAATMALIPVNFALGYNLTHGKNYSAGRSVIYITTSVMGTLSGALLPSLFDSHDRNLLTTTTLAGNLAGSIAGFHLFPEYDHTFNQGLFITMSASVGTLVGLAIPYLFEASADKPFIACGMVGGWSGFFWGERLSREIFENTRRDQKTALQIDLPFIYQAPVAFSQLLIQKKSRLFKTQYVDVISIRF